MPIEGFIDYKRREYCNDIRCRVQTMMNEKASGSQDYNDLRDLCINDCIHSTYEFHHWLIEKGYLVVRPKRLQED